MEFKLLFDARSHLEGMDIPWHFCGGWAIDLFIGKETRAHKDLDITVSRANQSRCIDYLLQKEWVIEAPTKKGFMTIDQSNNSDLSYNNIWCMNRSEMHNYLEETNHNGFKSYHFIRTIQTSLDYLEVLFDTCDDQYFIYRRNPKIKIELNKAFYEYKGLPFLAPEVALLYKSKSLAADCQHDFNIVLNYLTNTQKNWLREALIEEYSETHEWLKLL
jgi:Aminoglycoside-2''-adenylyltransferase